MSWSSFFAGFMAESRCESLHHCRHCGGVVCNQCSAAIEVPHPFLSGDRVCSECYDALQQREYKRRQSWILGMERSLTLVQTQQLTLCWPRKVCACRTRGGIKRIIVLHEIASASPSPSPSPSPSSSSSYRCLFIYWKWLSINNRDNKEATLNTTPKPLPQTYNFLPFTSDTKKTQRKHHRQQRSTSNKWGGNL